MMKRKTMGNKIVRYALLIMALVIAGSTHLVSQAETEDTKAETYGVWQPKPAYVNNIRQTKATTNSYTIEWDASEEAKYYKVLDENGNLLKTVVGKTSVTIKAKAGTKRTLLLVAGRTTEEGEALESWARRVYNIKTTPKKVKNLASFKKDYIQWRLKDDRINIKWDKNPKDEVYAEGYKIVIYSADGKKKLKTYASTNPYLTFSRKDVKNKGFKCKVAGYITINNKKCYGEWSDLKTIIPGAKITSATMAGRYNVRLKWKKVDKAVKYTIYLCENPFDPIENRTYRKLGTVKGNKNSFVTKPLTPGKSLGLYVIPTVKIKGKQYTADKTWYTHVKLVY